MRTKEERKRADPKFVGGASQPNEEKDIPTLSECRKKNNILA